MKNYLLQLERYDFQDVRQDKVIQKLLFEKTRDPHDIILMSDKISIMTEYQDWSQQQFIITRKHLLIISLDSKKVKRHVEFRNVLGVSIGHREETKGKKTAKEGESGRSNNGEDSSRKGGETAPKKGNIEQNLLSDFIIHIKNQADIRAQSSNQRQLNFL